MTILVPMPPGCFEAFAGECIADYAADNRLSGRWGGADPLELARAEFRQLLPLGHATPDHHFFQVHDERQEVDVGFLWLAVRHRAGEGIGYVYSIKIQPEFRGRGHARAALDRVAEFARGRGLAVIALHVFAFNTGAQALYRSAGYGVTGLNMQKRLQTDGV